MIEAVIFDLDGVLVHTDNYHYIAWKKIADREGLAFDEEMNHQLRGVSRRESLQIILNNNDKTVDEERMLILLEDKNNIYVALLEEMSQADVTDEVMHTLTALREKGIKTAIGSSSRNAKLILKKTGMTDQFDAISDGTNITNSKPDPEVFQKAARMLGKSPAACLVLEDAGAGVEAGHAGGFPTAGIGEASQHPDVTHPIKSIDEILKLL